MTLAVNGRPAEAEVVSEDGALRVRLGDRWYTAELEQTNQSGLYSMLIGGRSWEIFARERPHGYDLLIGNRVYSVDVGRRKAEEQAEVSGAWTLTSPMAGQVVEVHVASGDEVQAGQTLVDTREHDAARRITRWPNYETNPTTDAGCGGGARSREEAVGVGEPSFESMR
jgi:biotin carboxyl carrier protein